MHGMNANRHHSRVPQEQRAGHNTCLARVSLFALLKSVNTYVLQSDKASLAKAARRCPGLLFFVPVVVCHTSKSSPVESRIFKVFVCFSAGNYLRDKCFGNLCYRYMDQAQPYSEASQMCAVLEAGQQGWVAWPTGEIEQWLLSNMDSLRHREVWVGAKLVLVNSGKSSLKRPKFQSKVSGESFCTNGPRVFFEPIRILL